MKNYICILLGLFFSHFMLAEVNINTAKQEELMTLSGIGQSKSEAIINYRIEHGKFKAIEEIKQVKGIGDGIFEKIKADIVVNKKNNKLENKKKVSKITQ